MSPPIRAVMGLHTVGFCVAVVTGSALAAPPEIFEETLTLRRLATPHALAGEESALANFSFHLSLRNVTQAGAQHTELFPGALVQLMQTHGAEELHLSMSSGYWDDILWGAAHAAPGVEVTAVVPAARKEQTWAGLSAGIGGVFCPALAQLGFEDSTEPWLFGWPVESVQRRHDRALLHATDPQQLVCLDHLRAFVRLLPCGSTAGLAVSLGRELDLFAAPFVSVRLHATQQSLTGSTADEVGRRSYKMHLEVATVINRRANHDLRPGSNLAQLAPFLSEYESATVAVLPVCCLCEHGSPGDGSSRVVLETWAGRGGQEEAVFDLVGGTEAKFDDPEVPQQQEREEQQVVTEFRAALQSFWQQRTVDSPWSKANASAPTIRSYLAGGNSYTESTLVYEVTNAYERPLVGLLWHTMPWAVELKYSSLTARLLNGMNSSARESDGGQIGNRINPILLYVFGRPSPRNYRRSPHAVEMLLRLPPQATVQVTVEFRRAFLSFSDYPSDAARGLDASAPALSYWHTLSPGIGSSSGGICLGELGASSLEELSKCPPGGTVYATAGLLIPFAWPDFSMPYNVICVSCSLPMLVFGTVLSGATRRPKRLPDPPRPLVAFILWWLRLFDTLFGD
eukprot:COSAG05_NODE_3224_length_2226_cov_72.191819_2_plen_626_part_00